MRKICLTFDLEERFHSDLTPDDSVKSWNLHKRIDIMIKWLESNNKKATFFVVGELAEKYPDLIKEIVRTGNEVACHSLKHIRLNNSRIEQCKDDISRAKDVLENISQQPVYGYRAPSWSAHRSFSWFWDHLIKLGFRYDSSLFPFKTNLYGSVNNKTFPHWIRSDLLEIPPTVYSIGPIRVPYSGGFYFRFFPEWFIRTLLASDLKKNKTPVLYFHPWDFELNPVTMEKGAFNRFIGNYNVTSAWEKYNSLFKSNTSITLNELYQSIQK